MFYKRQRRQQNECRSKCLVTIVLLQLFINQASPRKEKDKIGKKKEREREKGIYKRVRLMCVTHYHTLTIHFEKVFIEN